MFGLTLEGWNQIMVVALWGAAFVALTVAGAQAIVIRLQHDEQVESDRAFAKYKDDAARNIADANARASIAQAEAARANLRTEALRADNLQLQKTMQPRRLPPLVELSSPDEPVPPVTDAERVFGRIRPFAGTQVLIQVVPDFEARTLANDIAVTLQSFRWRVEFVTEAQSRLSSGMIGDGVQVAWTYQSQHADAAQSLAKSLTDAGLTGPAGWNMPPVVAQGFPVNKDGSPAEGPFSPRFDPSIDAVVVLIGMKPIPPVHPSP
jgi:hypothetical protein